MLSITRLLYLILVTYAAFAAYVFSHLAQSYWLIWSALSLLSLMTLGYTFSNRVMILMLASIGMTIVAFIAGFSAYFLSLHALFLVVLTMGCTYWGLFYPGFYWLAFIMSWFGIVSSQMGAAWSGNVERAELIMVGALITILSQLLFLPYFRRHKWRSLMIISLRNLARVNEEIFSCFLQQEYADHVYDYERRLHLQKNRFLRSLGELRESARYFPATHSILVKLERLYDVLLEVAQARFRVTDHTLFSVCVNELTAIANEIDKICSALINQWVYQKQSVDAAGLTQAINRLEETYQHVMQITAPEPLMILLWIASLKAFCEEISQSVEMVRERND